MKTLAFQIGLILCLGHTASRAVINCNDNSTISFCNGSPGFQPDIPSSANGDVTYVYEFKAWSRGQACTGGSCSGKSRAQLTTTTWHDGYTGTSHVRGNGVAANSQRDFHCCGSPNSLSVSACEQSKSWLSSTPTYAPDVDSGPDCHYDPEFWEGQTFYDTVASGVYADLDHWSPFAEAIGPVVTETSRGFDENGDVIWQMEYTHPISSQPGYYYVFEADCGWPWCPGGGGATGWSAYYQISVWVKQGSPSPPIPNPNLPTGGSGGSISSAGSGCAFPPSIRITSPVRGSVFPAGSNVQIEAIAIDPGGSIASVTFYYDGNQIGSPDTTAPYSVSWNTTGVSAGTHTITAKAKDNCNLETTSSPVTITLQSGVAPTVSLTGPANNSIHAPGSTITLSASASDSDGSVSRVDFYHGSVLVGSDYSSPYSIPWSNVLAGNYSLRAQAYDNAGIAMYSTSVAIQVAVSVSVTLEFVDYIYEGLYEPGVPYGGYTWFKVARTGPTTSALTVNFLLGGSSGEAASPGDFIVDNCQGLPFPNGFKVVIPAGLSYSEIGIQAVDDYESEALAESVRFTLLESSKYQINSGLAEAVAYIIDNDSE